MQIDGDGGPQSRARSVFQPQRPVLNRQAYFRTEALRQEVPAHYGVALHHVSAKVGMMSRLVWEDGMSWAETRSVERPASAVWLAPKSETSEYFRSRLAGAARSTACPRATRAGRQVGRCLVGLGVSPRRLMDGRMAVRPRLFCATPYFPYPHTRPPELPSSACKSCSCTCNLTLAVPQMQGCPF